MASQGSTPQQSADLIERVVTHGDLLFDLCESVLWSSSNAQRAFRLILKDLKKTPVSESFKTYERTWVLRVACDRLKDYASKHGRRLSASEQAMLDANSQGNDRLRQFDAYFHRLPAPDQILLLLRDKYGLPYSEIAAALQSAEGSLKLKRQQALRNLEETLWEPR